MFSELPLNFEPLTAETIDLESAAVSQAIAFSQAIPDPQLRWSSYLALLALEGFTTWRRQRSTPIVLHRQRATLIQPEGWDAPAAINHVYANQFHVCLIAVDSDFEDAIELPASAIHASQMAHFYVAIAVHEELKQISIRSFLRCDQLADYLQHHDLIIGPHQTYQLPISIFETDLEQLLLYLTCLEPSALGLPTTSLALAPSSLNQWLIQPAIDTGMWLQRQMNHLADELATTFFPPELPLPSAMRSAESSTARSHSALSAASQENLETVLKEIERNGIRIPDTARAAYQDIFVGDRPFRLYAIVWAIPEATPEPEWSLFAILESLHPTLLDGIRLIIKERNTPVIEKTTTPGSAYLIAQILGTWDEQFTVTVTLDTGESLTLPPFTFHPK